MDDNRHEIVFEVLPSLSRAPTGVLAEQAHDEVADGKPVGTGGGWVESGAGQASSVLASLRCRIAREKEGDEEVRRATGPAPCRWGRTPSAYSQSGGPTRLTLARRRA